MSADKYPVTSDYGKTNQGGVDRKCKKYFILNRDTKVYFNADFDSGNLQKVEQVSPYNYRLSPGYDKTENSTDKTFFHFKVHGFTHCTVRFQINKVHILEKLLRSKQQQSYKPVVKKGSGNYQPINNGVKLYYSRGQAELCIQYQFDGEDVWTYFAFTYPYLYSDMEDLLKELKLKFSNHSDIYFHQELLGLTQENRRFEMVSITERRNCLKQTEDPVPGIFPQRTSPPPKINRPKVIISGRVHPGETPASYCIEGLLRFLLDDKDYRSYLLRRNFHFLIIPMLNPDGVYNGLFRSDINGDNLNRVYEKCSKSKHPTIWYFREYLKSLQATSQPVMFYFDFHAHPSRKQFFIYGNAFQEFMHQAEAQTFGRLIENNCPYFHNVDSIFTEKQMNSKDRYDVLSKEGCARVYVHRMFNIVHSYTVECGYFAPGKLQNWESVETVVNRCQFVNQTYEYVSTWQQCSFNTYTPDSYMLMGKSILITILDLFHLNPYPRINFHQLRSISTIRKNVGIKIYNCVERFRLVQSNISKKIKDLTETLEELYYKKKFGGYELSISENYGMKHPKKKFSLLSKVYQSKKSIRTEIIEPHEDIQADEEDEDILDELDIAPQHEDSNQKNEKPYKFQLSTNIKNKGEEIYLSKMRFDCLHVSKIIVPPSERSPRQEENSELDKKIKQIEEKLEKKLHRQSTRDIILNIQKKRSSSDKSLHLLRIEGRISQSEEKFDEIASRSLQKKIRTAKIVKAGSVANANSVKLESRALDQKWEDIEKVKCIRIQIWNKKQKKEQKLQSNLNSQIEQQLLKMRDKEKISRFPPLYTKIQQKKARMSKKSLDYAV